MSWQNEGWDNYFMAIAAVVASKSKDRSRKVGCVIVDEDHAVRATGYNGFPAGADDDVEARHERPAKYLWTEHAERNAIYQAARRGTALDGCTAYMPWFPCMDCARALAQSGVVALVAIEPDFDDPQWGGQFRMVVELLREVGVAVRYWAPPKC